MNRERFMAELESLLSDISASDRMDAIDYYNSYFDEAGVENEGKVISELGNPGKVAGIIKANLNENSEEGYFTESGFQNREEERAVPQRIYRNPQQKVKFPVVLLIVIGIFAFPLWGGVLGALFGILIGVGGLIIGILASLLAGAVSFIVGGAVTMAVALLRFPFSTPDALVGLGLGAVGLGIGIFLGVLLLWLLLKFVPKFFRWCVDGAGKLLHQGKEYFKKDKEEKDKKADTFYKREN